MSVVPGHGLVSDIRTATPADVSAVLDLLSEQLQENSVSVDEEHLRSATLRMLQRPELGRILVAIRDDAIVGVAVLSFLWTLEHGGATTWLDELYVAPHQRRAGLGSRLLEAAMALARARGCRALDLEVEPGHESALRLYERQGFRRLPRERWMLPLTRQLL
jgi:ribosomal protein S18 acetylase RimI-like enzyme